MGDRRSILVHTGNGAEVVLYSHWSGSELPTTLARALQRGRSRWDDAPYLTRMIFSQMLAEFNPEDLIAGVMGETDFGIEAVVTGNDDYCEANSDYDLFVDMTKQQVFVGDETWYSFEKVVEEYFTPFEFRE